MPEPRPELFVEGRRGGITTGPATPTGRTARVCSLAVWLALVGRSAAQAPPVWVPQGSAPSTDGQVEGLKDREVAGGINAVAPHPKKANKLYVGAVNGGVWVTDNATDPVPTW